MLVGELWAMLTRVLPCVKFLAKIPEVFSGPLKVSYYSFVTFSPF